MDHIISSIIGTTYAEIITLPICTVKTVYQNSNNLRIRYIISNIYKKNGIQGFF